MEDEVEYLSACVVQLEDEIFSLQDENERLREDITNLQKELNQKIINNPWHLAVDEELIISHIGTSEAFQSPKEAINALLSYSQGLGSYIAFQSLEDKREERVSKLVEHFCEFFGEDCFDNEKMSFFFQELYSIAIGKEEENNDKLL